MSGVRTGTRLERLYLLRSRIAQEISSLEREQAINRTPQPKPTRAKKHAAATVEQQLQRLNVDAYDVKAWAVGAGIIDTIRRGRVSGELVDAYTQAHQ